MVWWWWWCGGVVVCITDLNGAEGDGNNRGDGHELGERGGNAVLRGAEDPD